MKHDFRQENGTIKRIQVSKAPRKGRSTMGKKYEKGDAIVHLSSSRATGERWVFLPNELKELLKWSVGQWWSRNKWEQQIFKKWNRVNMGANGGIKISKKLNKWIKEKERHPSFCDFMYGGGLFAESTIDDRSNYPEHLINSGYELAKKAGQKPVYQCNVEGGALWFIGEEDEIIQSLNEKWETLKHE